MLQRVRTYLGGMTWPIIVSMLALMAVSLLAIHAAEKADPNALAGKAFRQGQYVAVALTGFFLATMIPFHRVGRWAYLCFALNLGLLGLVFFLRPIRGSHRWINLRLFMLQPSELAKLTYILALAWYLRYRENYRRLRGLILPFVLTLVPAALILKEPDLGTTLLLFPTLLFMLFLAGARLKHLLAIVAVAAAVALAPVPQPLAGLTEHQAERRQTLAYWQGDIAGKPYVLRAAPLVKMRAHQLRRIEGWLGQSDDRVAADQGFQLQQSMMILGAGGLTGKARPEAMRLYFRMLPDDHTDFIFAVIGGRWGFIGCIGVMLLYLAIFICGAEIASLTHDAFGRLLVVGVLGLLFAQIFINVGMTMGLTPITGMTLPLVSYGGSSMVVNGMALGLLVNVGQRRPILLGRKPFDHDGKAPEAEADVSRPLPQVDWPRKRWGWLRRSPWASRRGRRER